MIDPAEEIDLTGETVIDLTEETLLTEDVMTTVESTAPILRDRGVEITTHFYGRLFAEHPEVEPMFSGDGFQPERLAAAVLAYAKNVRNLDALGPAVEKMAHAHVRAGVQATHYDVVGSLLLESIDEVLGGVDQSVLDAWGAAYQALANVMIDAESALVAERA